jgi:hypothetical protein
MTIWHNKIELCFIFIIYIFIIALSNALNQKHDIIDRASANYFFQLCGSWKLVAADWYWFSFLQRNIDQLKSADIVRAMNNISILDPHFTSAFRLGIMSLITYQKSPSDALTILHECMKSKINQADWRLYGYQSLAYRMLNNQSSTETKKINKQLQELPAAHFLLSLELPEMPSYFLKRFN